MGGAAAVVYLAACGGSTVSKSGSTPAAGVAGSGTSPSGNGGSGGTLRIAMSAGNIPFPTTPPNEGYEGRRFVGYQIYDGLFRWNVEQGDKIPTPQPSLAESYALSDDKTAWTFKLKQGVKFHDGTPFNAQAVLFNLDRVWKKDSEFYDSTLAATNATNFRFFDTYSALDDYTVQITTKGPYAFLPYELAFITFASPMAVKTYGNKDYNQHAVGTGPFMVSKYVDGQVMELVANKDYFRGRPRLDKIVLLPTPEATTRLASLQSGDVDWAEVPAPDSVEQLKSGGYQIFMKQYPHGIMPRFNFLRPPFTDIRLRQAFNYAVDREGTANVVNKTGYAASQYFYKGHPYYDASFDGYHYDQARAKALLAEAGYGPGKLRVKFAYTTGGSGNMFPGPMMEKIQSDLKAVGVETDLQPMEWNTLITVGLQGLFDPRWQDIDILWSSPGPVAPTSLTTFLSKQPSGAQNVIGYGNPKVDDLYFKAAQTFDEAQQNSILAEMQGLAARDAAFIAWMHDLNLRAMSPKVKGFVQPQSWFVDLTQVWMG